MTTPNPDITGNDIIDRQAGGDRIDDDGRATEDRSFEATPSRPDLDLADDIDTGQAIDGLDRDADDTTFHTSTVEANRSVEQGNGVGELELETMADPNERIDDQLDLNAQTDTSRDDRQNPLGPNAASDAATNIGGGR